MLKDFAFIYNKCDDWGWCFEWDFAWLKGSIALKKFGSHKSLNNNLGKAWSTVSKLI